ncbi:MAG TPA: histidinol-phosphate transaminase [Clostridia bacterium]|nr:histidinol-phosphate transaminase [Clostridia bacterium]
MNPALVSTRARGLTPYTPGEQPQDKTYIKLNTNENPYPPAPAVQTQLRESSAEELRLYPDPNSTQLREALAEHYQLTAEEVFVGNGSDEVLSFAFYAFFDPHNGPVLFPAHTYSFYPVYCTYYGLEYRKIPMGEDFSVQLSGFSEQDTFSGVIFPNPNAPTGIALSREQITAFLGAARSDRVYVIDEAYVDFGAESCSKLVREFPNLLVVHTFSKSRSLAGLRLGFALGNPELIATLFTVKDSFNSYPLNRLSQQLALRALENESYYEKIQQKVIETRERTVAQLHKRGWYVLPSSANFIFASAPGIDGRTLYSDLKQRGILIRHFNHAGIKEFVRITIGTEEQMDRLIADLDALYSK